MKVAGLSSIVMALAPATSSAACIWPFYCTHISGVSRDRLWAQLRDHFGDEEITQLNWRIERWEAEGGCVGPQNLKAFNWLYKADEKYAAKHGLEDAYDKIRKAECDEDFIKGQLGQHDRRDELGGWGTLFMKSYVNSFEIHPKVAEAVDLLRKSGGRKSLVNLGCNTGAEIFFTKLALGIPRAIGVELECDTLAKAQEIANATLTQAQREGLELRCEDAMTFDYQEASPGLVYLDDSGWDETVLANIDAKLTQEVAPGTVVIGWSPHFGGMSKQWRQSFNMEVKTTWQLDFKGEMFVWERLSDATLKEEL